MMRPPAAEAPISPFSRSLRILIVECDRTYRETLVRTLGDDDNVRAVDDFQSAYARLSTDTVGLLVTNLDLQARLEGLELAHAVATLTTGTRTLVYGEGVEPWTVREIQRAGAFYEPQSRLLFTLAGYTHASLPILDRRNPVMSDRRTLYRGGRRASDVPLIWSRY